MAAAAAKMADYDIPLEAMRPPRLEGMALAAPITVRDGDPCHVTVEVAGIPIPDITWFHGSREIKNCSDFRVDDKGTSCTLYIAAVTEELTTRGVRVVARNRVGVETKSVELKVYKVHTKWKPMVKSESFSTRSPDTFLRKKRGRRKVQSGISVTSLNREGPTKPSRSMSVGANWTYSHASHSTDSILDEVFCFDRKSAFATSTPRDVDPKNSQSQEINQISPISHTSPTGTKQPSPRQKDVMTDSGFSENIFRYRSSETDDKHIQVGRVPPIALPEDFDIEPIISPKFEERLMSPREPKPMIYQQQSAVLETKPPSGRPTDTLPRDGRRLSANGQIWISEKKISKSLSAMQNVGADPALGNKKYMLASQEKWESQEKVKRRSTGARLEASPPTQQQQQKMEYKTRQQQVDAFLRCDEPDTAVVLNNISKNAVPNNISTNPIIKRKASSVPKRPRPVSETNLDDFVVLAPSTNNNTSTEKPPHEEIIKEVSVTSLSRSPQTLSSLPKDESQLARIQISGINTTDAAVLSPANNADLTQRPNLSGADFTTEKDTSVALLGLTGKKGEQKRQTKGKDQVLSKAEIEGPSFHPEIPKASSESKSEELSSVEVSQQLSKAAQVMATIEAGKINKKDPKRKMSPSSNDKGMQWVYPSSKQERDKAVLKSKSNVNLNNSAKPKVSDTSHLPCVKVLDDAISYIYAEAFAHFGDTADTVSTPLAQMAKKTSQDKDSKVVSQLLEYPYIYRSNGVLPRLSEASDEDSSSQNNKDNFSNNNSTKSKYAPDLLNGINTNSNNRQEPNGSSELDMDSADVIGLSDEIDVKSLRDQVEPSQPCTCPADGWSSPKDLQHGSKPSSTDQRLMETSTNHADPIKEGTSNVTICADADTNTVENIKICDNNPKIHPKNKENSENDTEIPEEADITLGNMEHDFKEEDIESDNESVQTVIEVGEDQTLNCADDAEFDNNLQGFAQTLVDEVLRASIEVILAEEAALDGIMDAGTASRTEPHTSTTPEDGSIDFGTASASGTEPHTSTLEGTQSPADACEAQQKLASDGTSVDAALMVNEPSQLPVYLSDVIEEEKEENIRSHLLNQPPTSAEDELNPEDAPTCVDAVIPVIFDHALASKPHSEVVESTAHPESVENQVETHNKPPVAELSEEELARIDSYVAEIISEAIAIFSSEEKPAQKIENESPYEGAAGGIPETYFEKAPRCEPLEANESFIQQVESWVADVINEAITIAANQEDTAKAMQGEADYTSSQQTDAESLTLDINEPSTKDSHQVTYQSVLPQESPNRTDLAADTETDSYTQETHDIPVENDTTSVIPEVSNTQTGTTEGEFNHQIAEVDTALSPGENKDERQADLFGDEQPEDEWEHIELDTSDLLQNSRNRTYSLSSISEESEEDVSFVDETFQISDIPSTTYKSQEVEENKLVMDTFSQIDLPGHAGAENKALGYLDQNDQGPSVSPDPATGNQGLSGGEVVEGVCYTPEQSLQHAQQSDTDTEGLIERQEAAIVCSTSQPLNLTLIAVSSDSEVLESSITDDNTLDLSWDNDMGPELSFTAADRMAYSLRMVNSEGRVKRDSETNTEPGPVLIHAATDVVDVQEGITDIRSSTERDTDQSGKTDLSKTTEYDTAELDNSDITKLNKDTKDDYTCSGLATSDMIQGATAAATEENLVDSPLSSSSSSSSSSQEKETDDSPQSIGSTIRDMLTKKQGAVLFLLLAVAVMVALSWWESADV